MPTLRALARWSLLALALLVPLSGCIVIAPGFDAVDNCPIRGDSLCGTCLRAKCQADINTCCGTEGCSESTGYGFDDENEVGTTIAALDACAGGDTARCGDQLESAYGSTAKEAVNRCVTNNCRDACVKGGASLTKWTCSTTAPAGDCATCIYDECAAPIQSCCSEGSGYGTCASILQAEMSACVAGDEPGCSAMLSGSASGKAGVLRACVKSACAEKCFGNGRKHQRCSLENGGDYCSCSDAETSSGDECSSTALPKSHCFFHRGGCMCGHYACEIHYSSSNPSCSCTLTSGKDGTGDAAKCNPTTLSGTSSGPEGAVCCITFGTSYECTCDLSGSCGASGYQVFSCDKSQFFSALTDVATDTCSQ